MPKHVFNKLNINHIPGRVKVQGQRVSERRRRMDDARSNSAVPAQRKRPKMLPDPESNSLQMRWPGAGAGCSVHITVSSLLLISDHPLSGSDPSWQQQWRDCFRLTTEAQNTWVKQNITGLAFWLLYWHFEFMYKNLNRFLILPY